MSLLPAFEWTAARQETLGFPSAPVAGRLYRPAFSSVSIGENVEKHLELAEI